MDLQNQQVDKFYKVLFNEGENTNFVGVKDGPSNSMSVLNWVSPGYRYFSKNPIKSGKKRATSNVAKLRNFLFEMDKMPLDEQIPIFEKSNMPYSTVVYSGGKSYHYIVSLEEEITEQIQYEAIWKSVEKILNSYGGNMDPLVKNPSGLSRMPGAIRENGVEQKLIEVKERVPNKVFFDWIEANGVDWQDFVPKFAPTEGALFSSAAEKLKLDWILKYKMANLTYEEGNRNHYQFVLARHLKNTGLSKPTVYELVKSHCGEIHDNGGPIDSAFKPEYDNDEKIYVPTMEERRQYYRDQEKGEKKSMEDAHKEALRQLKIDTYNPDKRPPILPETEVEPGEHINRYIMVGTEYFKIDVEVNRLIPWNASVFEKVYGKGVMPPKAYDDFIYNPDYLSPLHEVLDSGSLRQYRNHFQKPLWIPNPGDWGTVETALRNAFKDQFDLALKYAAISILYPKQPLPIIVFVGDEGVGKSGVIKIFQLLLGEKNCKTIKSKQFESDFEGHLQSIQLLVIEEAGNWKDPSAVAAEFKRLATERGKIWVNPKFGRQIEVPFYGKFMLTSNDLSPVRLEGAATRFWVVEMQKLEEEFTNYFEKIAGEMGAFAHHLINVIGPTLAPPSTKSERLYFAPEEYWTPAKEFMKEFSKSDLYFEIEETFNEFFTNYPDQTECWFDLTSLKTGLKGEVKDKAIKAILKKEWGIDTRTEHVLKPDSLRFSHESASFLFDAPIIPKRKSRWFRLEKSKFVKK